MNDVEAAKAVVVGAETNGAMNQVRAELREIAAAVDRVSDLSHPTMELLEASRAIQSALVSLGNWSGSTSGEAPVLSR
ncbi:MAG TPA: hypothetical protein VHU85_00215 [Acidimicrobiales bacterium]|jgi:hypothetical protein|nr:hypothetical protein [Acidimicrobiales bacterium]